jgi:peroxiredoxin
MERMSSPRALALLALLLAVGCRETGAGSPTSLVGSPAPAFGLETLSHGRFYLNHHRAQAVVLLFWHTTCEACKRQMVALEPLRTALGRRRVVFANVCTDPENTVDARRWVKAVRIRAPTLLDRGETVRRRYRIRSFPTTVVIAPGGVVGFAREGYTEQLIPQLRRKLESLLQR